MTSTFANTSRPQATTVTSKSLTNDVKIDSTGAANRAAEFGVLLECVRILPITKFEMKIGEYVDAVSRTHDQITITKNGSPAAVLVGVDEWESIQETLHWLAQPDITESVAESETDIAAGRTYGEDDLRTAYNKPRPL